MLVPYQLPLSNIFNYSPNGERKKEGQKNGKKKENFSNFPFPLQLGNCHNDFLK
jgi:hypothetical protein